MKNVNSVDFSEPATFFETRLGPGMVFSHLSQALRHAANMPLAKRHHAAKIITKSGDHYGWEEINVLHDHLRAMDGKS